MSDGIADFSSSSILDISIPGYFNLQTMVRVDKMLLHSFSSNSLRSLFWYASLRQDYRNGIDMAGRCWVL
jgi:hypothetical protein